MGKALNAVRDNEMAADATDSATDAYLEAKEKAEDTTDKGGKGTEDTGG